MDLQFFDASGDLKSTDSVGSRDEAIEFAKRILADNPTFMAVFSEDGKSSVAILGPEHPARNNGGIAMSPHFRLRSAMAAVAAAGVDGLGYKQATPANSSGYPTISGRICGWDNGKPKQQIQVRNSPCMCGSGKKAKKCCVYRPAGK